MVEDITTLLVALAVLVVAAQEKAITPMAEMETLIQAVGVAQLVDWCLEEPQEAVALEVQA